MPKRSAGVVLVSIESGSPRFLLVHPGGPLWQRKDLGAWSIPKGEYSAGEDPQAVALRELAEELGRACPATRLLALGDIRQPSGKIVTAWCAVGEIDATDIRSNKFEMVWPPQSGLWRTFPEVDRAEFFSPPEAVTKILPGQREFLVRAGHALIEAGVTGPDGFDW